MIRNSVIKSCSFRPTNSLHIIKGGGSISAPIRSASSINGIPKRCQEDLDKVWPIGQTSKIRISEEEVRRFVVGLSTMLRDGKLRPSTSRDQVIQHFTVQKHGNMQTEGQVNDQVDKILARKTKTIKSKHNNSSVLEWIY